MSHSQPNSPGALKSFVQCKCPRCREGRVFHKPLYELGSLIKSYERCPVCDVKFEQETGFYWTAMYISYALSTGLILIIGIIMVAMELPLFDDWKYFGSLLAIILFQMPFSFRYSRMLALYLFSPYRRYEPNYKTEKFKGA